MRPVILLLILAVLVAPAAAQTPQAASPESSRGQPNAASLRLAYEKEYAFLEAQRRALQERIETLQRRTEAQRREDEAALAELESRWLTAQSQVERLQQLLLEAERTLGNDEDQGRLLEGVLEQARTTLATAGQLPDPLPAQRPDALEALFQGADSWLGDLVRLRRETGDFFLEDGRRVSGRLIYLGAMAAYGVSSQGAGALVPAGEGRWQLWPDEDGAATARAVDQGRLPETLALFLIDRRLDHSEVSEEKGLKAMIESGGIIAWVIVTLGVLGLLLVTVRIALLQRARRGEHGFTAEVVNYVERGDVAGALEHCRRQGGAQARLLAAVLENLGRHREHQDDIIGEAILRESGRLDRFGGFILVIAAVSPLLGLLGTVTGMITTFDVITQFGTGDPKLLSGGISEALVTTELGLVVAIPLLILGNLLNGWAEGIKRDLEHAALHLTNRYDDLRHYGEDPQHVARRLVAS